MRETVILACMAVGCATPSAMRDDHRVLTDIDFVGNETLSADDLKQQIATRQTTGWLWKDVAWYDPEVFAVDRRRLVRWYAAKGFYRAQVTKVDEVVDSEGRVKLVVHVDEGKRALVESVEFEGGDDLTAAETQKLREAIPLRRGVPFDEDRYEKSKLQLLAQITELGFAQATLSGRVQVDSGAAEAKIVYRLRLGPRVRFGAVTIAGNDSVPTRRIADAVEIDAGASFQPSVLRQAEKRIYQLGVFSGVRVTAEPEKEDSAIAPVRVRVREAPFHTVRLGVGAELDSTRWQLPLLRAEYTDRNLGKRLLQLDLQSTLGLAFVPDIGAVVTEASNSKIGITTNDSAELKVPRFWEGLDLAVRGEFARELQSGYAYDEVAARFSLGWHQGRHTVIPSLNFVRYFNGTADLDAQSLVNGGNEDVAALVSSNCIPSCTLTYPEVRYTFDLRDNPLEPKDGFYFTVDLRQTIPGSFAFFRIEPEVRGFISLSRSLILGARAQYGALILEKVHDTAQSSPFPQRFFGGGQSNQRGYASLQQGPKVGGIIEDGRFTTWLATGGNGALLLSAELRWLTDFWIEHTGVVFFVDASRISAAAGLPWEGGPIEIAPGIGIRYITPLGAFRLDVAGVVNPTVQTLPSVTAKAADGSTIVIPDTVVAPACSAYPNTPCLFQRRWAFHLSIGEAF